MERHTFELENGTKFILDIGEIVDSRYNEEGVYQDVFLRMYDDRFNIYQDVYETNFGRFHALNFFKNINISLLSNILTFEDDCELEYKNIQTFKEIIIEKLKPIETIRGEKISKIKNRMIC